MLLACSCSQPVLLACSCIPRVLRACMYCLPVLFLEMPAWAAGLLMLQPCVPPPHVHTATAAALPAGRLFGVQSPPS